MSLNANQWFFKGLNYYKEGNIMDAIKAYKEALKLKPDHEEALINYGIAVMQLGKLNYASVIFKDLLKINSNNDIALTNLGFISDLQGKENEAIANYKKAVKINPKNSFALNNLGMCFLKKFKLDKALKYFKRAIKNNPTFNLAWYNLGKVMEMKGLRREAVYCWSEAAKLDHQESIALVNETMFKDVIPKKPKILQKIESQNVRKKDDKFLSFDTQLKKINKKILKLFDYKDKFTFLVGAGISMDPPSCLLSAKQFSQILLEFCCPKEELDNILKINNLKYEFIVEGIKETGLDPNLEFLEYYELLNKPNLIHFFLAEVIKRGYHIITTNFDYLIEYALMKITENKKNIKLLITKNDFQSISEIDKLRSRGNYLLVKIHGSKKNIITNEDTSISLITTISSFARERKYGEFFKMEPYKRKVLEKLVEGRTLVLFGYSGRDEFDITPALKEMVGIKKLIWVNHKEEKLSSEDHSINIKEITKDYKNSELDQTNRLLINIKKRFIERKKEIKIFRIDVNTYELINIFLWPLLLQNISLPKYEMEMQPVIEFRKWVVPIFIPPFPSSKYHFASWLYYRLSRSEDSLRCSNIALAIDKEKNNPIGISKAFSDLSFIYEDKGLFNQALKLREKALEINKELNNVHGKASNLNNIGEIYRKTGRYNEALRYYEKALEIDDKVGNDIEKACRFNNIGLTYRQSGDLLKALQYYDKAFKLVNKEDEIYGKATLLSNIASVYQIQGKSEEALELYEEALQIARELDDLQSQALRLGNIAFLHLTLQNYTEALKTLETALELLKELGLGESEKALLFQMLIKKLKNDGKIELPF